jgi:hypothetical protein
MLPNALPYQLKVRDFLKTESSIWEFYSMNSSDEWEITDRIIDAIFEKNDTHSGFWHMARLYRLYAAFSRDRAAGKALVKTDDPEYSLRVRVLQLWQDLGEGAEAVISRLIERKQELDMLDVFGRERVRELTKKLIGAFLRPAWIRMAPAVVLALEYFPDLSWPEEDDPPGGPDASYAEEQLESVATEHGSIRDYFAFVLIDLVAADPALEDRAAGRARNFAARLGIADSFAYIYENYGKTNQRPL